MASEPAYVVAFKEFTKSSPTADDIQPMETEFYGESDRACGILFGSYVELALGTALKSGLRPDLSNGLVKSLFDHEGPLGTFSAKINLGYAFSLFGKKTKHDLELIRLMRNQFAHCQLPIQFKIPEVKAVCDHLQIPDTHVRIPPWILMSIERTNKMKKGDPWDDNKNPKTRFVTSCHSIVFNLFEFAKRPENRPMQRSSLP